MKIDSAGFIKFHALLFKEGLLHILAAERERGGSLAQAVYYPVARNNARLRVDMQSIADDARPARIAGESRYLPVSRNAAARDFRTTSYINSNVVFISITRNYFNLFYG